MLRRVLLNHNYGKNVLSRSNNFTCIIKYNGTMNRLLLNNSLKARNLSLLQNIDNDNSDEEIVIDILKRLETSFKISNTFLKISGRKKRPQLRKKAPQLD